MRKMLVLTVTSGEYYGKQHIFASRIVTVGSATSNQLVLFDRMIESRHAEIHQQFDRWFVVPLRSNGHPISLNGKPIRGRSRLQPNDLLTIGSVSYHISLQDEIEREVGILPATGSVPRLGEYLVRRGFMSSAAVAHTVRRQVELEHAGIRVPFGQVAYDLGYINHSQLNAALAEQHDDLTRGCGEG